MFAKKICAKCNQELFVDQFYKVNKGTRVDSYCKSCKCVVSNAWKRVNKDRVKAHKQRDYEKNKAKRYATHRNWLKEHPEHRAWREAWLSNNRDKTRAYERKYTKSLRETILDHYGHYCNRCGIVDDDVLDIDHVNNDGNLQRRVIKGQYSFYKAVIVSGFSNKYQILCRNCNWKKHINGGSL